MEKNYIYIRKTNFYTHLIIIILLFYLFLLQIQKIIQTIIILNVDKIQKITSTRLLKYDI